MPASWSHHRSTPFVVAVVTLALLAGACGSGTTTKSIDDSGRTPQRGGKVVYGLEAETQKGFCLPDAQLVVSGIQVARTIYDTLTLPNDKGGYSPYVAESVAHDPTYKTWTVVVRRGVTFHDGTPLNADVVKANFDAYRGKDPKHPALLFRFVFSNLAQVASDGDRTVTFTMDQPWVDFDAFLYGSGRIGMMALAQLDAPAAQCATNLIGTGPFRFKQWVPNDHLTAVRNSNYWLKAPDGQTYPYLDEIEYRPVGETSARQSQLEEGALTAMHLSDPISIRALQSRAAQGQFRVVTSNKLPEVTYLLLNNKVAPFDDIRMRKALALGLDRKRLVALNGDSPDNLASGPFGPGVMGHLDDAGFPVKPDVAAASDLVKAYAADHGGKPVSITLVVTTDPASLTRVDEIRREAAQFGVDVQLEALPQSQLVDTAIAGQFQVILFRNHPGGDPDTQHIWWYGKDNPVNFSRFDDPEVNRLLTEGRTEADPARRRKIYEALNRRFGSQFFSIWLNYVDWAVATAPSVHGIEGPSLPDGSKPSPSLVVGHAVTGMWVG